MISDKYKVKNFLVNLDLFSNLYSTNKVHQSVRFYSNRSYDEQSDLWNQFKDYYKEKTAKTNQNTLSSLFTHLDEKTSLPKQVDISEKKQPESKSIRVACASGYIQLNKETFDALVENKLKKGNALIVAQIAGIQASKQTQNLIPLCHQILLDVCDVNFILDKENNRIKCEAICKTSVSKTGVEMEALTSCSVALLTIYDMCKALQKDAVINDIKLEYKYGGKSDYKRC